MGKGALMKEIRILGFNIMVAARKANISDAELGQLIGCSENDVKRIYTGRLYMSFQQLATIANHTNTNVSTLLTNKEDYEKYQEQQCGKFSDSNNREKIFDIIDDYLDLIEFSS